MAQVLIRLVVGLFACSLSVVGSTQGLDYRSLKMRGALDRMGTIALPPSLRATRPAQRPFTDLWVQVMVANDDLRVGGTARIFMEMEDGSRATAPLASPGEALPGNSLYNWRWKMPAELDPLRIRRVGISTNLHMGDGQLLSRDTWKISRLTVFATREPNGEFLHIFDDTVRCDFNGADEWKSGEVASFRGPQFTRASELTVEVISSSSPSREWDPTVGWQAFIELSDGRKLASPFVRTLATDGNLRPGLQRGIETRPSAFPKDEFGRMHAQLRVVVPDVVRGQIRRVQVYCQPTLVGTLQERLSDVSQINVWAGPEGPARRQWFTFTPNERMRVSNTLWSSPPLAPLVLPQDIKGALGVEIWSADDDLRQDSRLQLVVLLRPDSMFSQPQQRLYTISEKTVGAQTPVATWFRSSSVPSNSRMLLGTIAPQPLQNNDYWPPLSTILAIGLRIEPGPGGGTWNPDTFTIRHLRFHYSDGRELRELWSGYGLNLTLDTNYTQWLSGDPSLQFGTPLRVIPPSGVPPLPGRGGGGGGGG